MPRGVTKWFNDTKGFGFIKLDDGSGDVFIHHSEIKSGQGFKSLTEGQHVEFEIEKTPKGLKAKNLVIL